MTWRFACWRVAALVGGLAAGAAPLWSATAAEMRPDEAKAFIAGKLFSYTCFDGTSGAGRIQADGSVIGTMQVNGGLTRHIALPSGTVQAQSKQTICPHSHWIWSQKQHRPWWQTLQGVNGTMAQPWPSS